MRNNLKNLFLAFSALSTLSVSAQSFSSYSDVYITLKSDSSTRSALISNLLEDRVGDISPIIGTASWSENDKRLQCRSLLFFNYGVLPKMIRADQIIEAELILKPVEIITKESLEGVRTPRFTVRRITEPWEDSMTSWLTQPESDPADEVTKLIKENKKWKPVRIDVTDIVRKMFKYGNNGFMISYADSEEASTFLSQWFASARYEEEDQRPELVIRWSYPLRARYPNFDVAEMSPIPRDMYRGMQSNNNMYSQGPSVQVQPVIPVPVAVDPPPPKPKGNQEQ